MSHVSVKPVSPTDQSLLDSLESLSISGPNQAIQKTGSTTFTNVNMPTGGGTGTVTSITTVGLITGGPITTAGTITTQMNTLKLVGRTATGAGIMQEIAVDASLYLQNLSIGINVANSNSWTGDQSFYDFNGNQVLDTYAHQLTGGGYTIMFDWTANTFRPDLDIQFPNQFTVFQFGSDPSPVKSGLPLRFLWDGTGGGAGWLAFDDGAGNFQTIRANINADSILASTGSFSSISGGGSGITGLPLTTGVTGILPQANGGTGVAKTSLFDHFANVSNGTTVETDLYSDSLTAGQFSTNGQKVVAQYGGIFVGDATSTQRLKVYFGGTLIFDTGALGVGISTVFWDLYVTIIRVSSSVVRCSAALNTSFASLNAYAQYTEVTGLTLANAQILKITGTAAGATGGSNQITAKEGYVEFKSQA